MSEAWISARLANLSPDPHSYIGERFDPGAGLISVGKTVPRTVFPASLNNRYYDPKLAMLLQPDWWEVTEPGVGTNRYAYAGGDPVNGSDPGGHSFWSDLADAGRAFVDALSGNVTQINNEAGGQTSGPYGLARIDGTTYGCYGCGGSGIAADYSVARADATLQNAGGDVI